MSGGIFLWTSDYYQIAAWIWIGYCLGWTVGTLQRARKDRIEREEIAQAHLAVFDRLTQRSRVECLRHGVSLAETK